MMNCNRAIWIFGLLTAALLTPNATFAQGRGGAGGGMGGMAGPALIGNPAVQKELELTDEQTEKAKDFAEGYREKARESMAKLEGLEGEERMKKVTELNMANAKAGMKDVNAMLKPEQAKRFGQIVFQMRGIEALTDPDHAKSLKVTAEQSEKVRNLLDDQRAEMREAMQDSGGDRAASMRKMLKIRKETNAKAMALMTPEQMTMYKEMSGEAFEMPAMRRDGGGR